MTTTMNNKEMMENELDLVNGGKTIFDEVIKTIKQEIIKCGKNNKTVEGNKRLHLPEMDADNRPAIDFKLHVPTLTQKQ